jgi:hypothetical protein
MDVVSPGFLPERRSDTPFMSFTVPVANNTIRPMMAKENVIPRRMRRRVASRFMTFLGLRRPHP